MSLPSGFLDDLRQRVPISRVVGRRVTWDLRKSNQARGDWWAPCPFHQERTASFHCDDQKGFFYCFGCQASGDAIGFLKALDGMDFMDAVKALAAEAGVGMPAPDPRAQAVQDRRDRLRAVTEAAAAWFRLQLATAAGAEARAVLDRRGVAPDAQARFEIGFAPDDRAALRTALRGKGFPDDLIAESGMGIAPDDGGAPYDRFRGRIMFPIRDARGRVAGFGGRAMAADARAKYLNSPETPLFDKGRLLYNIGPARAAVARGAPLLVAEGYMDVIALDQAGQAGAVAPLGTAITAEQLALLWRIAPEPVVMLDGDEAGQRAALRLIDLALPLTGPGQALRFAALPPGLDPDDLLRAEGPGAIAAVLAGARPLLDLLWDRAIAGQVFDSPERRAALESDLRRRIGAIADESTRRHYEAAIRERMAALFRPPRLAGPGPVRASRGGRDGRDGRWPAPLPAAAAAPTRASRFVAADAGEALLEGAVLALLAAHPALVAGRESRLERLAPRDPGRATLCHALLAGDPAAAAGPAAVARAALAADPYLVLMPVLRPEGDLADAAAILDNALDRIETRRALDAERSRAESEIVADAADEGLTWRMLQAARARQRADHPAFEDATDLGEDRVALAAELDRLVAGARAPGVAPPDDPGD